MLHFIFTALLLIAGVSAFQAGYVTTEVAVIGLFFSGYLICMAYLFRN